MDFNSFRMMLADFYSLSSFYEEENSEDRDLWKEMLPKISDNLLLLSFESIEMEIKHLRHRWLDNDGPVEKIFSRFQKDHDRFMSYGTIAHNGIFAPDKKNVDDKLVSCCKVCFNLPGWYPAYGGSPWANICDRWLKLYRALPKINYRRPLQEYFSVVDQLIDACHNTGNCFDKHYGNAINSWLHIKTKTQNPYWVIRNANFKMQKYAFRRMKERYGMTYEKYGQYP